MVLASFDWIHLLLTEIVEFSLNLSKGLIFALSWRVIPSLCCECLRWKCLRCECLRLLDRSFKAIVLGSLARLITNIAEERGRPSITNWSVLKYFGFWL